jgi:hypothetical protein
VGAEQRQLQLLRLHPHLAAVAVVVPPAACSSLA